MNETSADAEERLVARTSLAHCCGQVLSELKRILQEHGEDGYRNLWQQHAFPLKEMRDLERAG